MSNKKREKEKEKQGWEKEKLEWDWVQEELEQLWERYGKKFEHPIQAKSNLHYMLSNCLEV
ncbi:hypothetical protein LCGC14_1529310 [marine sediment metagenome]|uniref:Uncharacterized protein n=1 Tax=marine sediment metagenome TaxID=412755 RepID=A0A0F9JH45_9ZZZZ